MNDDLMIVRKTETDVINLSVGEPFFLQDIFNDTYHNINLSMEKDLSYPAFGGQKELIDQLKIQHPDEEIIIANGGKQGLLAAMYALDEKTKTYGNLFHKTPYWPSYPTLASLSKLYFSLERNSHSMNVITAPNNPDGSTDFDPNFEYDIADMAYGHEMYGFTEKPLAKMYVWSASKVLGLSGIRVGWITTKDPKLANLARTYMEITTSGVSSPSQHFLSCVLKEMNENPVLAKMFFTVGKHTLLFNGYLFMKYLGKYCDEIRGVPKSGNGMFAFFKVKDKYKYIFENPKVKLVNGAACGIMEPNWFRMSMGHLNSVTEDALKILVEGEIKVT